MNLVYEREVNKVNYLDPSIKIFLLLKIKNSQLHRVTCDSNSNSN